MFATIEIEFDKKKLEDLAYNFQDRVREGIDKTLDAITLQTIQNIEQQGLVRTGFLRDSVGNYMQRWNEGYVVVGANYAILHELGTVKFRMRPFLGPAVAVNVGTYLDNLKGALQI